MTGLLDCGDSIVGYAEANTGPYGKTPPPALHENLLVHGAGAVDACWMLESPSVDGNLGSQGPVIPQPVGGDR
jgi:hypothetical protein